MPIGFGLSPPVGRSDWRGVGEMAGRRTATNTEPGSQARLSYDQMMFVFNCHP